MNRIRICNMKQYTLLAEMVAPVRPRFGYVDKDGGVNENKEFAEKFEREKALQVAKDLEKLEIIERVILIQES